MNRINQHPAAPTDHPNAMTQASNPAGITIHQDGVWTGMDGKRRRISLMLVAKFAPAIVRVLWKQVSGRYFYMREESDHLVEFVYMLLRKAEPGTDNHELFQEAADELALRMRKARQGGAA